MTATVTTRVPEDVLRQLDEFSAAKNMDRATMLRNLISEGLAEERRKKVLSDYKERKISLQKAAELLKVHLIKMLELIREEGIYLDYTEEELREDLKGLPK